MINRTITTQSLYLLKHFPSLVILGARQVGKTTFAKTLSREIKKGAVYFDLENDRDLYRFELDAQSVLEENLSKLVIIDEVQRMPKLFALLRSMIDLERKPARYLLLGSASPALLKGVTESLAGRVSYIDLHPMSLEEAQEKKIGTKKHWFRGGYPEALLAKSDALAAQWLSDYVKSYIQRDLAQIYQLQVSAVVVGNFWRMLASSNGAIWNAESYARALGVTGPTVSKYLDLLEGAFMVNRLQPWFVNVKKRVIKAPKVYIVDSGILHCLNNIDSAADLERTILIGASWEGYVLQQIRQAVTSKMDLFYYRTQNGAECDIVLVKGNKPIALCEIKFSETPTVSKGFYACINDMKTKLNFVIIPGVKVFEDKAKGIIYCGLQTFLTTYLKKLTK